MARKQKSQNDDVIMITQSGYDQMVIELEEKKARVADIAREIDEARKLGDLSENEPYTAAMQKKDMNDARIAELEYMIANAQIVSGGGDIVGIGSTLEIQKVSDKSKRTISLVGRQESQEADPREGKLSIDSPLGTALNMSKPGDVVTVTLPAGEVQYKVLKLVA